MCVNNLPRVALDSGKAGYKPGSILSMESNQNVESKTKKNVESKIEKCGVQNSICSVDSQENH